MEIVRLKLKDLKPFKGGISLCLGYFDGLHVGHLALINRAKDSLYKSAVLTFINLNKRNKILTSLEDKIEILTKENVDYLLVLDFNQVKDLTPVEFIELLKIIEVKEVIIGGDYTFGKEKKGDASTLKNCTYFQTILVPFETYQKQKISTSFIVNNLLKGNMELVSICLKRYYQVKGKVIEGKGNGRLIDYPTLNLRLIDNYLLPHRGVYKGYCYIDNNRYLSMINVGIHPTISPLKEEIIEVHLIDVKEYLYGKNVALEFVCFLRDEIKFTSFIELKKQLDKDKKEIINSEVKK